MYNAPHRTVEGVMWQRSQPWRRQYKHEGCYGAWQGLSIQHAASDAQIDIEFHNVLDVELSGALIDAWKFFDVLVAGLCLGADGLWRVSGSVGGMDE